jgi:hypothetical protein
MYVSVYVNVDVSKKGVMSGITGVRMVNMGVGARAYILEMPSVVHQLMPDAVAVGHGVASVGSAVIVHPDHQTIGNQPLTS